MSGRQKRILMPEPPWGDIKKKRKLSRDDNQFHVVYGGTATYEHDPSCKWKLMHELCKRADFLDIHLHLYFIPWDDPRYETYREISKSDSRVTLHKPVEPSEWVEALTQYDAGLLSIYPDDHAMMGNAVTMIDTTGCWSNKFSDYLDAGLYTIGGHKFMSRVAQRYNIGQPASPDTIFTRVFWQKVKENVRTSEPFIERAQRKFRVSEQHDRLLKFYLSLNQDEA